MRSETRRHWFEDRESAEAALMERHGGQKGWTVLAADEPMSVTCGYSVFRTVDADGNHLPPPISEGDEVFEQCHVYEWPEIGERIRPQIALVDPATLLALVGDGEGFLSCDDAVGNRIGFVRHDPENGTAVIRQCGAPEVRRAYDEIKVPLLEAHRRAKEARGPQDENMKRAAVITGALAARAR